MIWKITQKPATPAMAHWDLAQFCQRRSSPAAMPRRFQWMMIVSVLSSRDQIIKTEDRQRIQKEKRMVLQALDKEDENCEHYDPWR